MQTPKGWRWTALDRVCEIQIGGTPSRKEDAYWDRERQQGFLWASISDLTERTVFETSEYITKAGVEGSSVKLVPAGTVMMSFKLTIGRTAIAGRDLYTNEAIASFLPRDGAQLDHDFLLHQLPLAADRGVTDHAVKGRTLNKAKLRDLPLLLPPLAEQKKIAEILGSVDDAIAATKAVIEQTKQVKKGLLQELLTKGIGHTKFKQTEIGEIPESWDVVYLDEVLLAIEAGKSPACENKAAELNEVGVLKVSAVGIDEFHPNANKRVPSEFEVDEANLVKEGDVLFTRANTADLVGAACRVDVLKQSLMLSDKTLRLVPRPEMDAGFLVCILNSPRARREFEVMATGTSGSMKNISQKRLQSLVIPFPPIADQVKIARALSDFSKTITICSRELSTLESVKLGLLQDLLTGKVRVAI